MLKATTRTLSFFFIRIWFRNIQTTLFLISFEWVRTGASDSCAMEAARFRLAIEGRCKNSCSHSIRHGQELTSNQLIISESGGSGGIGSFIASRRLVGRLGIAESSDRHGVFFRRGCLGVVNSSNSSRYGDLKKADVKPTLPSSSSSSSELGFEGDEAASGCGSGSFHGPRLTLPRHQAVEEFIEKAIFNCRFFTLMAVAGSLAGSTLCFLKGCTFVFYSFKDYFQWWLYNRGSGKVVLMLVQAIDVYLMGTVMLIFGMGLYELFVSSLQVRDKTCTPQASRATACGSNLFGLFKFQERPKWLEIQSLDELKTKLGHVIVMVLLIGMFEKSKKVPINTGLDLLFFSGSVLLSSGCLFLLANLKSTK